MDNKKLNEDQDNDESNQFKSSFPLFNLNALRKSQINDSSFNFVPVTIFPQDLEEEILQKKRKTESDSGGLIIKSEQNSIEKREKNWDDPDITIKEIVENKTSGVPMESEIHMKKEKAQRQKAKKHLNVAQTKESDDRKRLESILPKGVNFEEKNQEIYAPQIVFKDGKAVVEDIIMPMPHKERKLEVISDQKKQKLSSMSFRTKDHSAKWTPEETRKFYKAIEIFGADFSLVAKFFPKRNRNQLKKKFLREEKTNPDKINQAFKIHSVIGKRKLLERMKRVGQNLDSDQNINTDNTNLDIKRKYSTTSIDSMDLKVMEDLQDIFSKDIQSSNILMPRPIANQTPNALPLTVLKQSSLHEDPPAPKDSNHQAKDKTTPNNKENLLLKLIR